LNLVQQGITRSYVQGYFYKAGALGAEDIVSVVDTASVVARGQMLQTIGLRLLFFFPVTVRPMLHRTYVHAILLCEALHAIFLDHPISLLVFLGSICMSCRCKIVPLHCCGELCETVTIHTTRQLSFTITRILRGILLLGMHDCTPFTGA
jgi:hypothetical protein